MSEGKKLTTVCFQIGRLFKNTMLVRTKNFTNQRGAIEEFLLSNFFWSITPLFEDILRYIYYKMCSKSGVMDH